MKLLIICLFSIAFFSCSSRFKKIPVVTEYGDTLIVNATEDYLIGESVKVRTNLFVHVMTDALPGSDTLDGEITYVINAHVLEY